MSPQRILASQPPPVAHITAGSRHRWQRAVPSLVQYASRDLVDACLPRYRLAAATPRLLDDTPACRQGHGRLSFATCRLGRCSSCRPPLTAPRWGCAVRIPSARCLRPTVLTYIYVCMPVAPEALQLCLCLVMASAYPTLGACPSEYTQRDISIAQRAHRSCRDADRRRVGGVALGLGPAPQHSPQI